MSKRVVDINGWITIKDNPILKAGIFPYLGSEIGQGEPSRVYKVLRSEEELSKPETIKSFELVPLINEHFVLGELGTDTDDKSIDGIVGESIYFEAPYLKSNIKVFGKHIKKLIEVGKIELSAGYSCKYIPVENNPDYDFIQTDIRANHLALVEAGRNGSDVAVQDALKFTLDSKELLMNLEDILAQISALSDEDKAKLLATLKPAEVENTKVENKEVAKDEKTEVKKEVAKDEEKAVATDMEKTEVAKDAETPVDVEAIKQEAVKEVMTELAEVKEIANDLTEVIGEIPPVAMDSKAKLVAYGLDKLKIKAKKGEELATLRGYLQHKRADKYEPIVAQDSALNKPLNVWGGR